jgi:hypothetical protein
MNRELLAAAALKWIEIQNLPAQAKHSMLALWIGAVIDAIDADHDEPESWEALYLSYALHAVTKGAFYGALTFSQMGLHCRSMFGCGRSRSDPVPSAHAHTGRGFD